MATIPLDVLIKAAIFRPMVSAVRQEWANLMWMAEKPIKFMPRPIDSGRWSIVFFRESGTGGMCRMVALLEDEADPKGHWGHLFQEKFGYHYDGDTSESAGYVMRFLWRVDPFHYPNAVMSAIPQRIEREWVRRACDSFRTRKLIVDTSDPKWLLLAVVIWRARCTRAYV